MRIGITQRVEVVKDYGEKRDCLDQNWTKLLTNSGLDFAVIPNSLIDIVSWLEINKIQGIVLTGGNDLASLMGAKNFDQQRDELEKEILNWGSKNNIPILGVCRGMQLINKFLLGDIRKVKGHVTKRHKIKLLNSEIIPKSYYFVNSYHNWGMNKEDISEKLEIAAIAEDNTIEAFVHKDLPWVGVMWHPEREDIKLQGTNIDLMKNVFLKNKT